jgi:carbonic anhydrase
MSEIEILPAFLKDRFDLWKVSTFSRHEQTYRQLASEGQSPRAMFISCCDSRVNVASIFGVEAGELFIHRNIAGLVPPCEPSKSYHGTSAALEYAVRALKVSHIVVLGHSNCGGVQGCLDMCTGRAPELEDEASFIGRWMDLLREPCGRVVNAVAPADQPEALEKEAIQLSLKNLITFPFVLDRIKEETLSLHGLWVNIGSGELEGYDAYEGGFVRL